MNGFPESQTFTHYYWVYMYNVPKPSESNVPSLLAECSVPFLSPWFSEPEPSSRVLCVRCALYWSFYVHCAFCVSKWSTLCILVCPLYMCSILPTEHSVPSVLPECCMSFCILSTMFHPSVFSDIHSIRRSSKVASSMLPVTELLPHSSVCFCVTPLTFWKL